MARLVEKFFSLFQIKQDKQSIAQTNQALDTIKSKAAAITAVAAPAAVVGLLTSQFNEARALADATAKQARAAGVTTEAYQEMGHAAKLSGVAINDLRTAMAKQAAKSSAAAKGDKGLLKIYRELGLNAKQLAKLSPDQQMERIADALQKVPNQSDRLRLMMKLFEEAGPKFASMFAGGAKGIQAMRKEAKDLGLIISDADAQKAEAFNDSLDKTTGFVRGLARTFSLDLVPALKPILDDMVEWAKGSDGKKARQDLRDLAGLLGLFFKTVRSELKTVRSFSKQMGGASNMIQLLALAVGSFVAAGTLMSLVKGFGLLNLAMLKASLPILGVTLLLFGLFLILSDFGRWVDGRDSLLGDFIGPATPSMIEAIQLGLIGVLAVIAAIALAVGAVPIALAALLALVVALGLHWEDIQDIVSDVMAKWIIDGKNTIAAIKREFLDGWKAITEGIGNLWDAKVDEMAGKVLAMINKVKGVVGDVDAFIDDPGGSIAKMFGGGAASPALDLAAGALGTINNRPQQNNTNYVTINGSNLTEEELKRATTSGLNDAMLRQANNSLTGQAGGT